jgi:hypothetical protein
MTGTTVHEPRGRHRLGTAGLRHCRDIDRVRARLTTEPGRHAARQRNRAAAPGRRWTTVGVTIVSAVLAVSAWFTATGASAVAQMITP